MAYFFFREIWTPLKLMRIRFFYEPTEGHYWIKVGNKPRKRMTK